MNRGHVIRIHRPDFDPAKLTGRIFTAGDCLEPWLPDGSWTWFERDAPWKDGDLCLLSDSRKPGIGLIKAIYAVLGGQVLCSNLPAVWLRPEYQRVIGPLAVSVEPPAWCGRPFAEESVEQCEKNAAFRQAFADCLRSRAA